MGNIYTDKHAGYTICVVGISMISVMLEYRPIEDIDDEPDNDDGMEESMIEDDGMHINEEDVVCYDEDCDVDE